jgi:hypothetical protein
VISIPAAYQEHRTESAATRHAWRLAVRVILLPATSLERSRGRRRLALISLYTLIIIGIGVLLWRRSRLAGLPDVPAPFDPKPLLALSVPDDRNAYVLYHEARLKLKRNQAIERRIFGGAYAWPSKDEEALAFLASNDEAVELWLKGTTKPDALPCPIAQLGPETGLPDLAVQRPLFWHALTRASREESQGEMAGAWVWYRGLIRSSRHSGRHAPWIGRVLGCSHDTSTGRRIATWAADPRVDSSLLSRALHDVLDANTLTPPDAEAIQLAYVEAAHVFRDPEQVSRLLVNDPWDIGEMDKKEWKNHIPWLRRARWFLANEPERSWRVVQLSFTNLLDHWDDTPSQRPPMVGTVKSPQILFNAPFRAPREARGVSPTSLAAELEAAVLNKTLSLSNLGRYRKHFDRDRSQRANMVLDLARQLYAREHLGQLPVSDKLLIGTYLDRLPDDPTNPAPADAGKAP